MNNKLVVEFLIKCKLSEELESTIKTIQKIHLMYFEGNIV